MNQEIVPERPPTVESRHSHVDACDIVDFDYFHQPGFSDDPFAVVAAVFENRRPRIIFTPQHGGHWVIGGYQELFDAFRAPETFSSLSMQIPEMADEPKFLPLNSDPPEHSGYRAVLNTAFSPGRIRQMEEEIRKLAVQLIDGIGTRNEVDFITEVAEPLPVFVVMKLLGIPLDRFRPFRDNVHTFLTATEGRSEALGFVTGELQELIAERRVRPRGDLISHLIVSRIDDRPIAEDEVTGLCQFLIFAGLDTVTNAMALAIRHLAIDPALQDRLRGNPSQIPLAIEELLRRYAFANEGRILLRDVQFHGIAMKKGDRALFLPPGAGLDPDAFPDPATVIVGRKGKGIPTFGFGPHRCVGMHLARLELNILLEEWLRRIPQFSLSAIHRPVFHGGVVFGLRALPLSVPGIPEDAEP